MFLILRDNRQQLLKEVKKKLYQIWVKFMFFVLEMAT